MLRFAVRARPGARRTAVGGRWDGPGGPALVVAVAAPAVDGKANTAILAALATAFDVRPNRLTIVSCTTTRTKLIELADPPPDATTRLRTPLAAIG